MGKIDSLREPAEASRALPAASLAGSDKPLVSIVMPNHNRAALIGRAIRSCLAQTCRNFEVVVVDDGSSDSSLEVIRSFADPRIVLVVHERNRGVCPARNTGVDHARADWVLMLDSDDELFEDAVETLARKASQVETDVGSILFRCQMDDGSLTPADGPIAARWDYEAYLRHLQACTGGSREMLHCVRRSTFEEVRFPDNFGLEDQYHLDSSRRFVSVACVEVLRKYHQDATDSLVKRTAVFDPQRDRKFVLDRAENVAAALRAHRGALRLHAPALLAEYESRLLTLWLLSGHRARALATLARIAARRSELLRHMAVFLFGMVHPALLATVRSRTRRLRTR